jgi:hypothetical protein
VELDPVVAYEKALVAIDSRSWTEAVRQLQKVLELDPAHPHARAHLEDAERRVRASALIDEGRAAHGAGKWEEAVASFREAADLDPDFSDEDGLLADAAWRVDVLRQPTEVVPEPATVSPSAPTFEPAPMPVEAPTAPAPSVGPPAYQPRRKSNTGLIVALAVGIPVAIYLFLIVLGLLVDDSTSTTTNATTQTTLPGTTVTGAVVPSFADITAQRMTSQVTIDAEFTEWAAAASTVSGVEVFPGSTQGDLPSGHWWVGWDDLYLYIFVDVTDTTSVHQPWEFETSQLWRGDSVNFEFGEDPRGIGPSAGLRTNDLHVLFGPINLLDLQPALVAVNRVRGNAISSGGPEPDILAVSGLTDGPGYLIEAAIPWHVLGVSNPTQGAVFGMNANVSDSDGDPDGDGVFDLRVMVSSNPDRIQTRPGTWNTLVLGP